MGPVLRWSVPDPDRQPEAAASSATPVATATADSATPDSATADPAAADPAPLASAADQAPQRRGGWPLPVKVLLAAVVLGFVWSPFLAMLVRLSNISPDLAPAGRPTGVPDLAPPLTPGGSPPAGGRRSPVPSP